MLVRVGFNEVALGCVIASVRARSDNGSVRRGGAQIPSKDPNFVLRACGVVVGVSRRSEAVC
jgi:hypothetical protein